MTGLQLSKQNAPSYATWRPPNPEIHCAPDRRCVVIRMGITLLGLPANALEQIARELQGDAKKELRATCRELRAAANAVTDFISVEVSEKSR